MNNGNNFPNTINSSNTFPNSMYAPFGTNDNNFNRQRIPSNIFPPNGGFTGNPTGQYNPLTTTMQRQWNNRTPVSSFNDSFQPNSPIIEKLDYNNRAELLHNNIGPNVLDEHVIEYRIYIDSLDRDIKTYPDPFSFTVKFNAPGPSVINTEVPDNKKNQSNQTKFVETRFEGTPCPHINKEFRNVKYIKLENIILPQFRKIVLKPDGEGGFDLDQESNLTNDRYISLVIKELVMERYYSTSDNVSRISEDGKCYTPPTPFALILPDKYLGSFFTGIPYYGSKVFKSSSLGNIKQLTIQFYDSCGLPIKIDELL